MRNKDRKKLKMTENSGYTKGKIENQWRRADCENRISI